MTQSDLAGIEFTTIRSADLDDARRALMYGLFDECYDKANHTYLDRTLEGLRYVTLAFDGDRLVGFGSGENRIADLPGLAQTHLALAGLSNVAPDYRRRGLVSKMGVRNQVHDAPHSHAPRLLCGRNAHPASLSMFKRDPSVVPRAGRTPTAWQQDVGRGVAEIYGVENFDPETFVCVGDGTPIGYPVLDIDAEPPDWEVFRTVNRDRGDTLLAIVWLFGAPEGW